MPSSPTVQLQQPTGPSLIELLFGGGNSGFVEGSSDTLDWANLIGGNVPVLGDILGLVSRQSAAGDARRQQNAANAANERRYSEVLGLNTQAQQTAQQQYNQTGQYYADRVARNDGMLDQQGQSARREIQAAGTAGAGQAAQQARAGGMTNSTVNRQAQMANTRGTQTALGDLNERIAGMKFNARNSMESELGRFMQNRTAGETGLIGDRAGVIERRTDKADWLSQLPAILAAGRSGGGGGGGGLKGLGSILGGIFG